MMTPSPIRSFQHAATYYERSDHSDYYSRNECCPSAWYGKGAKSLGISDKAVESEEFKRYLDGRLSEQQLGTVKHGKHQRKPGWDLMFAPPKSVSIAALVGRHERVIAAHHEAVKSALDFLEENAAYIRIHSRKPCGADDYQDLSTGNLMVAIFRHDTSRAQDPQLHSHAVVVNATQKADGQWRSLDSRHFYSLQKAAGLHYRQHLAAKLRELGYELRPSGADSFELRGMSDALLARFSQRRDLIDKVLAEHGYTRDNAPPALKEKIAHRFRQHKQEVNAEAIHTQWIQVALANGFDAREYVQAAERSAVDPRFSEVQSALKWDELEKLVRSTIVDLAEREAVFSKRSLLLKLQQRSCGFGLPFELITRGVEWANEQGLLVGARAIKVRNTQFYKWEEVEAFTTPQQIKCEQELLELVVSGREIFRPVFSPKEIDKLLMQEEAISREQGFSGWTMSQKTALRTLSISPDSVTALQGHAGVAKTSTVLRALVRSYENKGYRVIGMAPSASAVESLAEGANLEAAVTVAAHLCAPRYAHSRQQIWLVDEASLISSADMLALLKRAKQEQARVVLVGDVRQLDAVGAGAPFRQLIDHGIRHAEMSEIVRQQNISLLDSVHHAIDGEGAMALKLIEDGAGRIVELSGPPALRYQQLVDDYMAMSINERARSLLIEPSQEGRQNLTSILREALKQEGSLSVDAISVSRLVGQGLTREAAKDIYSYQLGDILRFQQAYDQASVAKFSHWHVESRDTKNGVLKLKNEQGQTLLWSPLGRMTQCQLYRPVDSEICLGDRLQWSINDRRLGFINGTKLTVESIDWEGEAITVRKDSGGKMVLHTSELQHAHWSYAYISTTHAAQGKTADRVFFHAESYRSYLTSQKALYVAISRAKHEVFIYTDSREKLIAQLVEHTGASPYAMERAKSNQMESGV
jgi:conjugative relaxase-like TrwC/TraI family protein